MHATVRLSLEVTVSPGLGPPKARRPAPMYVAAGVLLCAVAGCRSAPPGTRWVLPERFTGCVEIEYGVEGAPPLPEEQGFQLIVVPIDAGERIGAPPPDAQTVVWKHRTSSLQRFGEWQRTEVYASEGAKRRKIEPAMGGSTMGAADGSGMLKRLASGGTSLARTCFGPNKRASP